MQASNPTLALRWSRVFFVVNTLGLKYKLKEKQFGEKVAETYKTTL